MQRRWIHGAVRGDSTFEASPSRVLFQTAPFAALRLRTDAAKRFEKVENAAAVIWKMLLVAERKFRRLNAPELVKEVTWASDSPTENAGKNPGGSRLIPFIDKTSGTGDCSCRGNIDRLKED